VQPFFWASNESSFAKIIELCLKNSLVFYIFGVNRENGRFFTLTEQNFQACFNI